MDPNFWWWELGQTAIFTGVAYSSGLLVERFGVKVNYTRKVNFFALYLVPLVLGRLFPYSRTLGTTVLSGLGAALMLGIFLKQIRSRVRVFQTMFSSFDRPEDRPHTLLWLSTQIVAGYAVLIPMSIAFERNRMQELAIIPVLIHGIGDGMAEPVGIRFGRHKYSTRTFLSMARRHTRSYEGSACVLVTGIIAVGLFHNSFTSSQFIAALITVPLLTTLAEAWSPHTWDTPYMFLAGGLSLFAVKSWL